jgi:predicted amidohydrolase YtcJ
MRKGPAFCLIVLAPAFVSFAQAQTLPPEVAQHGYADLVVVNGKIVSMDDRGYNANPGRIYQAMAVKEDEIIALGTTDYIRTLANQDTTVIDVEGRVVIPGIVNPHSHMFGSASIARSMGIPYPGNGRAIRVQAGRDMETTRLRIETSIKDTVAQMEPGQWLYVGIDDNREEGATANKIFAWTSRGELENPRRLDPIAPDNPVLIQIVSRLTANTAALEMLRDLVKDFDLWEAEELADLEDPTVLGQIGLGAEAAIEWEIWYGKQPVPVLAEMVRRQWEQAVAHGETTFGSRTYNPRIIDTVSYLNRTGTAPMRFMMLIETHRRPAHPDLGKQLYKMIGSLWGLGDDMMWIGGVSSELWDSSFPLHCFGDDVPAPPNIKQREMCREPGNLFWDAMENALGAGWRTAGFHGVASDGVRRYTRMIEGAMQKYGLTAEEIRRRRPTVEHVAALGTVPDIMAKIKEFGIILAAQPTRMYQTEDYIRDYGPEVVRFMQPVKSWLDQGITVVWHGGHAGFATQLKIYMDRMIFGKPVLPDQALDRVTVLKMATTWSPLYLVKEDKIGTLEVGKLADFVVLDKDFFTIPLDEIERIKPQMTVVGGQVRALQADFARTLGVEPVGYQFPEGSWPWLGGGGPD